MPPVNFFQPDYNQHPNFKHAHRESFELEAGDCVYVPSFFFYQLQAFNLDKKDLPSDVGLASHISQDDAAGGYVHAEEHQDMAEQVSELADEKASKKLATAVTMRFEGNSELVTGFFHVVESEMHN